ncbi:hypothetical protein AGLY_007694 [Aphis glycines]|uniref:Uncharacterized protein n=1 Tax=Aphis glycines TaxID=307491 RepID=A0A6G0TP03_APHGL|nr:hypothetical protein AGLY_007694 [Aphis glycines]
MGTIVTIIFVIRFLFNVNFVITIRVVFIMFVTAIFTPVEHINLETGTSSTSSYSTSLARTVTFSFTVSTTRTPWFTFTISISVTIITFSISFCSNTTSRTATSHFTGIPFSFSKPSFDCACSLNIHQYSSSINLFSISIVDKIAQIVSLKCIGTNLKYIRTRTYQPHKNKNFVMPSESKICRFFFFFFFFTLPGTPILTHGRKLFYNPVKLRIKEESNALYLRKFLETEMMG